MATPLNAPTTVGEHTTHWHMCTCSQRAQTTYCTTRSLQRLSSYSHTTHHIVTQLFCVSFNFRHAMSCIVTLSPTAQQPLSSPSHPRAAPPTPEQPLPPRSSPSHARAAPPCPTSLAMACAVFLLSPVSRTTCRPMSLSLATATAASSLTVSAITIRPRRMPGRGGGGVGGVKEGWEGWEKERGEGEVIWVSEGGEIR